MLTQRTIVVIAGSDEDDNDYEHHLQLDESFTYKIIKQQSKTHILVLLRSQQIDAILLELNSSQSSNIDLIGQLSKQMGKQCPPIVVIGSADAEIAVQALKSGAADYLVKDRMSADNLRQTMHSAMKNAELAGKWLCSHEQLQTSMENMLDCFGIFSSLRNESGEIIDFRIDYLNAAACENNRMPKQTQIGKQFCEIFPDHRKAGLFAEYCRVVETGEPLIKDSLVWEDTLDDQKLIRAFDIRAAKLNDGFVASWRDITESNDYIRQIEVALQQKIEEAEAGRQILDAVMEYIPEAITIADAPDVRIRQVSRYGQQLIGRSPQVLEGIPVEEHVEAWNIFYTDGITRPTAEALPLTRAVKQGEVVINEEWVVRKPDGQQIVILCNAGPIYNSKGEITGGIIAWRDISDAYRQATQDKQVELERQRSEAIVQAFMAASPIALALFDRQLRFLYANEALAKINEFPLNEHLGRTLWESVPQIASQFAPLLLQVMETQQPVLNLEFNGELRPGVFRHTIANHYPVCLPNGEAIGVGVAVMDISEISQVQQELRESEDRFRTLADNISQFAWMADKNGQIFWYNQRWFDYTGLTLEEMQSKGSQQVQHPDHFERVFQKFYCCVQTGEIWEDTFPLRGQDGQYRWFLSRAVPVRDEQGEVLRWFGTNTDITDLQQAQAALRESENRLRLALKSAELGIWDFNPITKVLQWDEQCKAMFGLSPQAEVNYDIFLAGLHPEDRDRTHQVVLQSFNPESGGEYDIEYRTVGIEDGIERWIAAKGKAFFNQAGVAIRFIGTVLNITEKKRAEAEREQLLRREQAARETAERANRIKDDFLAVLSHELRSPLSPILGWSRLLQTRKLSETKTNEALAIIERNARLQTQLIDDLLDVAKIVRGKLSLNVTSVNLAFIIEAALDTVRTAALAKSISLHTLLPNIGQVSGDPARLQQIVWNLLSNAIKFSPSGARVDIELKKVGNQAQITVTDTGKGINPDFLGYIFESFRQEDTSIARKYGGLGLGLAIVRQLVEAHGGTIAGDSPGEGLGATFTVRLPLLNVEPQIDYKQPSSLPELDLTGIRVLAVDDDADVRELLTVVFTQYGAKVITVTCAAEVLAILESFQPDVLVSDIGMPRVDGYSLIQKIRTLPPQQGGQIKAIALTAYARVDDCQQALKSGFQQHVTKPLEPEKLVQAVFALTQTK
ncbi:PAS domain S-box protein [Nostoc paludosum FACHB-159]|uniref:histidine kinase n=2 Tax=Nostoc TaxID=1177 RepID=A0ABR8K0A9_9NOSO|nr:PAS domain S-box protein [Nostoc sp. FACHB-857]MBD2732905.1 PAS domain S-box protein [Nostoc paludosum FACHB-159]